jgi:sterol desaturase/sphingolipid hydroxylase (fatty acid hydroxylase superfamily)
LWLSTGKERRRARLNKERSVFNRGLFWVFAIAIDGFLTLLSLWLWPEYYMPAIFAFSAPIAGLMAFGLLKMIDPQD